MTAVAHRRPASVALHATLPPEPPMPPPVAHAVAAALAPVIGRGQFGQDDPGHYVAPPALSERDWHAAQRAALGFEALLAPVTVEHLAAWLMPVNAASRNPQSPQDFRLRVEGIAVMVADLPAAAFTSETRQRLGTGFFPSHEDVRAAVAPVAETWRRKRDALRGMRKAGAAEPRPEPLTDAEREAMQHKAAAVAAELRARTHAGPAPRPEPRTLGPRDLLASYEASGTPASLFRAQQLRRQLDGEA